MWSSIDSHMAMLSEMLSLTSGRMLRQQVFNKQLSSWLQRAQPSGTTSPWTKTNIEDASYHYRTMQRKLLQYCREDRRVPKRQQRCQLLLDKTYISEDEFRSDDDKSSSVDLAPKVAACICI